MVLVNFVIAGDVVFGVFNIAVAVAVVSGCAGSGGFIAGCGELVVAVGVAHDYSNFVAVWAGVCTVERALLQSRSRHVEQVGNESPIRAGKFPGKRIESS